ncbi:hypothetical protein ACFYVR_20245 [Rhodococcus sp. NPDC003318]|uniref:hypothetical protein n=1 Tax=Rhodococcus sp. NPDC003318 TaxID=3364503 RepID=UPI0036C1AAB5
MGAGRPALARTRSATLLPAFVVLAFAFLMAALLPAIDSSIDYDDRVVAGDVIGMAGDITFVPAVGWGVTSGVRVGDEPVSRSFPSTATLEDGDVSFTVRTGEFSGDAAALLQQIKDTSAALGQHVHVDGTPVPITTESGERGLFARYAGPQFAGALAAFVIDGRGVQVVAVGPSDTEQQRAEDIAGMITSIRRSEGASE